MSASYTYAAANAPRIQTTTQSFPSPPSYAPQAVQYRTAYPSSAAAVPQIISYNRPPTASTSSPPTYVPSQAVTYGQSYPSTTSNQPSTTYGPSKMNVLPQSSIQSAAGLPPPRFLGSSTNGLPMNGQMHMQMQLQSQPQAPPPMYTHQMAPQQHISAQPAAAPQVSVPPNMSLLQQHLRPVAPPSATQMGLPNLEYIVAPSSARDRPLKAVPAAMPQPQGYTYTRTTPAAPPAPAYHSVMSMPSQHDDTAAFKPIAVGDRLPPAHIDLHGVCVNLQEFFKNRNGIIFGLVGAFNPVDTDKAVPAILKAQEHFERLVDFVGCLVVNDPFVVKGEGAIIIDMCPNRTSFLRSVGQEAWRRRPIYFYC